MVGGKDCEGVVRSAEGERRFVCSSEGEVVN